MPNPTPKHAPVKLTKGYIDRIKPGPKDEFRWCVDPKGFGLRVNPTGKLSFIVQGRVEGATAPAARITIGPYGVFTADQARDVAREHLRSMRMGIGQAPVAGLHMAELALDDPERMLDLRAHCGDDPVGPFVEGMQRAALGGLAQFKRKANDPGDRLLRRTPQALPGPANVASRSALT